MRWSGVPQRRWPPDLTARLRTTRLVLEPLAVSHAREMVEVLNSPALYAVTGGGPPSLADLSARYARQATVPAPEGQAWGNWVLREGTTLVGYVQATVLQPRVPLGGAIAALAWLIRPQDQGRGLATEPAAAMVAHLRTQGVGVLTAWIADTHLASQAVARQLDLLPTEQRNEEGERLWVGAVSGQPRVRSRSAGTPGATRPGAA